MSSDSVTIILPTYNRGDIISDCIESIISQYDPNWRLIIIDNNSNDKTEEVCKKYEKKDKRIKFVKYIKHLPIAENWERGIIA